MNKTSGPTFLACLLVAGLAWAITEQELQDEADRLEGVYADLGVRIDACPGGACSEAADIQSDLASADADLGQLHVDRDSLTSCTCTQVDADIDDLDLTSSTQNDVVDGWGQAS